MPKPSGGRKRFIFRRSGTLLIGLLLAVLAFAAYFFLGNVLNPPPYQVVIVAQEVFPGETLRQTMLSVDAQQVHPKVAGEYVLQGELSDWLGATVNEPLHPGDPLTKARLVRAGNPAAARHLAIALEQTRLLVSGGDGNQWVGNSFNRFEIKQEFILGRFHLARAAR